MNFVIYAYLIYLRSLRNICVCVRIFIPMILPSAYLNDVSFLEMFGAFWCLLEPFRLRDTIFACVRSVEWRTRPLAALQLTAALGLWMFSKYVKRLQLNLVTKCHKSDTECLTCLPVACGERRDACEATAPAMWHRTPPTTLNQDTAWQKHAWCPKCQLQQINDRNNHRNNAVYDLNSSRQLESLPKDLGCETCSYHRSY